MPRTPIAAIPLNALNVANIFINFSFFLQYIYVNIKNNINNVRHKIKLPKN